MSLLILGNLNITDEQKKKIQSLTNYKYINKLRIDTKQDKLLVKEEIKKSDCIISCNFNLNEYFNELKKTKLIIMAETGIANIDKNKALQSGLNLRNLETYSTDSVVQYIMYCILSSLRPWNKFFSNSFERKNLYKYKSRGLEKLSVGILGYGIIGKKIATILKSFDCNIMVNTRSKRLHDDKIVKFVSKKELFSLSDILIVACDLNDDSRDMINNSLLNRMKDTSTIISISPREVFNKKDLYFFLKKYSNVNAFLDFDLMLSDKNINRLSNVHLSNHIAFYTKETLINRTEQCINILSKYIH